MKCQTAPKIDPQSASNFDPLEFSPRGRGGGLLASVFEPPTVVAGLDDLAVMGVTCRSSSDQSILEGGSLG